MRRRAAKDRKKEANDFQGWIGSSGGRALTFGLRAEYEIVDVSDADFNFLSVGGVLRFWSIQLQWNVRARDGSGPRVFFPSASSRRSDGEFHLP